ncbi:MAG: group II intron reverse transcriptase domain-containing protein [Alphaproteobacteria bacterium]|nr:group II intron reverse transcriptase domain-containing protein [Alphaproteobacteria bacterium]
MTFQSLHKAHKLCRKSKQHKRATISFEIELGQNLVKLNQSLESAKYCVSKYRSFYIHDPKVRLIEALPYKDRVVLMSFCKNVLEPKLENRLIYDNAASRKGKGTDFAIKRLHTFMRRLFIKIGSNEFYFLKCDIKKYFQNINHDILLQKLKKCGFDEDDMLFMKMLIKSHGNIGLPLGNQTSQWFALLYLDEIDRLVKERFKVKYYVRYMDDFILLGENKAYLQYCLQMIRKVCTENLKLELNQKTQIGKIKNGLDFLGFNHKMSASGKIIKNLRGSAKRRERHYIKAIEKNYKQGFIGDEYLRVRQNAFEAHLKGTKEMRYVKKAFRKMKKIKK